jgi:hypothetical protein
MNIGKRVRRRSILHPICTVSRTGLDNMALILLSLIVTATMIVVAISMMRHGISSDNLIRSGIAMEDFYTTRESAEQSAVPSPSKPFLVVTLPDGTIVTQRVAGQV